MGHANRRCAYLAGDTRCPAAVAEARGDGCRRERALEGGRKLKDVQELPAGEAAALLPATVVEDYVEAGDGDGVEGE